MFFKKKPDPFAGLVKCDTCLHIISEEDAQEIPWTEYFSWLSTPIKKTRGFCPEHRVEYQRVVTNSRGETYYKEFEVSKDGTPIGYVKYESPAVPRYEMPTLNGIDTMLCGSATAEKEPQKRKYTKTAKWKKARGKK